MSWTILNHPAVDEWLADLDDDSLQQVIAAVRELKDKGPTLRRPLADRVEGSRHHNMKELRPGSAGRSEIRILFAFECRSAAQPCWWPETRPDSGGSGTSGRSR